MNRSNNRANTNGGVAYSNANNDSANAVANYGSRLANNVDIDIIGQRQKDVSSSCAKRNEPQQQQETGKLKNKFMGRVK